MFTNKFIQESFDVHKEVSNWWQTWYSAMSTLQNKDDVKVGHMETEEVASRDKLKLLRFKNDSNRKVKTPLLISYALVNRFTIADLQKDKSLVEKLAEAGVEVYVMDWGYPDPADRYLDLDDYINDYIDFSVNTICKLDNVDKVNLLGICQGGVMALCYTALHPEKIQNLITMVTPVDFHSKNDRLSHMIQKVDIKNFVDTFGNVSGELLNINFNMLNPVTSNIKKWIDAVNILSNEEKADFFIRMEEWINDSPDQAGCAYKQFIETFYQKNSFVKKNTYINGSKIDLLKITQPVLNIYGLKDHLVPPESSKALAKLIASKDYEELVVDTGHIGMYVSSQAKAVPEQIIEWLNEKSN